MLVEKKKIIKKKTIKNAVSVSLRAVGTVLSLHSEHQPASRPSQWLGGGPPGRSLILEDDAEKLPAQAVGQPRVLDDSHLEALAAQHGVVVGVDGSAHPLDDHQVGLALAHHHRQHLVQAASRKEKEKTGLKKTKRTDVHVF